MTQTPESKATVALFATCLVDLMRPSVGFAAAHLIEAAGFEVVVPEGQTCCGQPNYNGGDRGGARKVAAATIDLLKPYESVVIPSGSCVAMIKLHYPGLFDEGDPRRAEAEDLSSRTHELVTFLKEQGFTPDAVSNDTVTYHDSCAGLRELGIHDAPRDLLGKVDGLDLVEMAEPDVCCGFGGTFCVKYPDISGRMAANKTADIVATGADLVAMGDVGCLLNIEGRLHREGHGVRACHVAELLAGMTGETDAD